MSNELGDYEIIIQRQFSFFCCQLMLSILIVNRLVLISIHSQGERPSVYICLLFFACLYYKWNFIECWMSVRRNNFMVHLTNREREEHCSSTFFSSFFFILLLPHFFSWRMKRMRGENPAVARRCRRDVYMFVVDEREYILEERKKKMDASG